MTSMSSPTAYVVVKAGLEPATDTAYKAAALTC